MLSLAFVPVEKVRQAFALININAFDEVEYDGALEKFFLYFSRTYIGMSQVEVFLQERAYNGLNYTYWEEGRGIFEGF